MKKFFEFTMFFGLGYLFAKHRDKKLSEKEEALKNEMDKRISEAAEA